MNKSLVRSTSVRATICFANLFAFAIGLQAQTGQPAPGSREAMWPAPTEADWALPCLVDWQRTFEDAVDVARKSGKPILICVNMDGEIASEHYAGIRYRREETASLYDPYVAVIASVYRHTPRDFDEDGQRVLCPRFGGVTCGEHIAIEPGLFDGFFEGTRVAPRHVMVEIEESGAFAESYDVYYAFDTASVFETIRAGIANRPAPPDVPDIEKDLFDLVESRDNSDRTKVEEAYRAGSRSVRRALLEKMLAEPEIVQPGLLRLALFDLDLDLVRLARISIAQSTDVQSVDLLIEALNISTTAEEREALVAALERLGESSQKARTMAVVHRGLGQSSQTVDVSSWSKASVRGNSDQIVNGLSRANPQLEYKAQASQAFPEDAASKLELAEAYLSYGVNPDNAGLLAPGSAKAMKYASLLFEDALRTAERAEELGLSNWRVDAIIALANTYLGRRRIGYERAEAAAKSMPPGAEGWTAMACLAVFAQARQRSIFMAERNQNTWPPEWLTDVNAAYTVLADSPYGTVAQVVAHYDFIWSLNVPEQAALVLENGLQRFPESWDLHARLRGGVIAQGGLEELESVYESKLSGLNVPPGFLWYAGYASLVTAEFHRRGGQPDLARAAYIRGIAHFERTVVDTGDGEQNGADHYIALALAGLARLSLERQDFETAVVEILSSFQRRSEAAASLDGLGLTPVSTAQMLLASLQQVENQTLADTVQAALDALDPKLLILPAFDNVDSPVGRRDLQTGSSRRRR
ncbi:MAG: hypothetical protein ACI8TQ_001607 [Planctomycetota bacterium]|jgi:hypothetical protein